MLRSFKVVPCDHDRHGRYCSKCGLEVDPPRLTFQTIAVEFLAIWLQRGFRDTIVGLTLAPGHQIRHYLKENRALLVKPVNYLIVIAAFRYWALTLYNTRSDGIDDAVLGLHGSAAEKAVLEPAVRWLYDHYYQLELLQAVLMALLLRFVFFRRAGFTLPEFTIAVTYIVAQSTLIQGLLELFFTPFHRVPPQGLMATASLGYTAFALSQLLGPMTAGRFARIVLTQALVMALALGIVLGGLVLWENGVRIDLPALAVS